MLWYKHLYTGRKAGEKRYKIIQGIRNGILMPGVHVIVPASGSSDILDILPSAALLSDHYRKQEDLLILGIADSYDEGLMVAGQIVSDIYRTTGEFKLQPFLEIKEQR